MNGFRKLALAVAAGALLLPASASAKTVVFAGSTEGGGKIAMDVRLGRGQTPRAVTELRGVDIPINCEQSGPQTAFVTIPVNLKVNRRGLFSFVNEDSEGNRSVIVGKFRGRADKNVRGEFVYANHFPAENGLPEEDCASEQLTFQAKKGAPDVIPPQQPAARLLR